MTRRRLYHESFFIDVIPVNNPCSKTVIRNLIYTITMVQMSMSLVNIKNKTEERM